MGVHPSAMPDKGRAAVIETVKKAKDAAFDPGQGGDEGGGGGGHDGGRIAAGGVGNAGEVEGIKSSAGVGSLKSVSLPGASGSSAGIGSFRPSGGASTLGPILSEGIIEGNADIEMDVEGQGVGKENGAGVVLPSSSTPAAARKDSTGGAIARLRMATKVTSQP